MEAHRFPAETVSSLAGVTLGARNFLDVLFPEKHEPLAPGSRGGFTFELDAGSLDPGVYALTVLVEDQISGERGRSQSVVRILDPGKAALSETK